MDYSTLNRLKDKLEQATSASKAASISAEIEKEERRIHEAEEREEQQRAQLLSSAESIGRALMSPRQQVESFIERGETIMKEEYHHITEPGIVAPDYIDGPKSNQWFSEIYIFNSRYLKDYPLHDKISEAYSKKNEWSISAYKDMMGYLSALIADDEFWAIDETTNSSEGKSRTMYDVFISHANADKIEYVDQLIQSLDKLKIRVFYDKDTLEWGDNWKDKIKESVERAEFAIIVISDNFFGREWTEKELNEFLNRQNSTGQKIILPILHKITFSQLRERYPAVADIQALNSEDYSCDEIALKFASQLIKRIREKIV